MAAAAAQAAAPLPLVQVKDVPLTGGTTRLDYASPDPRNGLLFLAHLGDSTVTVFDTGSDKVVKDIADVGHVHGVLVVPELDRVYASATRTDEVVVIDEKTLKITARIPGGVYPDGMAYVPAVHKLYVSDETGATETVIDTATQARVATLKLGGEAGNCQYDPVTGHVFVDVQTTGELVEIDPALDRIVARDKLGVRGNHGLLIDAPRRRAFIASEDEDKLLVFDLKTRKVLATFDVGGEPDVLAFDAGLQRLYVAGEKGVVSVFDTGHGAVTKLGEGFVGDDAHVVAVDPRNHRVYFPLKDVSSRPVLRIMAPP
ncbi:MAG: YncE family protein [Bacillota bacterium]